VNPNRVVEICPAAIRDIGQLLSRRVNQIELIRHAAKLKYWKSGEAFALDVQISEIPFSSMFDLIVDDSFGCSCGFCITFCEGRLESSVDELFIIGVRREDEELSTAMLDTFECRRAMLLT
jgi:hypothetical protein